MGASTDDGVTALAAQLAVEGADPQQIEMRLMEGSVALPTPAIDLEYVHCDMGKTPADFRNVQGKIALVKRGDITFQDKAAAAEKAGAAAVVIYNNREGNFFGSLGEENVRPKIPVVSIALSDGQLMLAALQGKESRAAKLRLTPEEVAQPDRLAEFSSRGPNNDGWIKPEITAPGVNIYSATITKAAYPGGGMPDPSGYVVASGTSMATPHVAGAAALIRQAHPDWTPAQIKAALVNTARYMRAQGTVMDQGNGAMDLLRAIDCQAILVTATSPIAPTHSFRQVVNEGKTKTVTQSLTIQPLNADAAKLQYKLAVEWGVALPEGLQAALSAADITCNEEGCVASFDLTITADGSKVPDGAYYGWVVAESEAGALRLPFYYEAAKKAQARPPEEGTQKPQPGMPPRQIGKAPCC